MLRGNVGNSYLRKEGRQWARVDEMVAQRVRAPKLGEKPVYNRPCERNRLTGSVMGIACRLKIHRATAKPIAA